MTIQTARNIDGTIKNFQIYGKVNNSRLIAPYQILDDNDNNVVTPSNIKFAETIDRSEFDGDLLIPFRNLKYSPSSDITQPTIPISVFIDISETSKMAVPNKLKDGDKVNVIGAFSNISASLVKLNGAPGIIAVVVYDGKDVESFILKPHAASPPITSTNFIGARVLMASGNENGKLLGMFFGQVTDDSQRYGFVYPAFKIS